MGARKYGISFRVFNSIAQELDVELNTRGKILYLQATMFYFFYYGNARALHWQEKPTSWKSENKTIDNPRIKIVKSVGAKAQDETMR